MHITVIEDGKNVVLSGVSTNISRHNFLPDLQGGAISEHYHLSASEYSNLVTGQVIRPSDTGDFYPSSNPSGYITGVDLSSYVSQDPLAGASGYLQGQITSLDSQTGTYYPKTNPSGYITGIDLNNYSTIFFSTGISGHLQGQISALDNNTGFYYLNNNPSGYITGVDLSAYVTGSVIRPSDTGAFYAASNPSGFITGVDLSSYVTGDVVRPSDTGIFYTINNPSGYITGVDLSPYSLQSSLTGTSGHLQGQITTLDSLTGTYYQNSNPSGYITGIDQISFSTLLPTGIEETGISFPYVFGSTPRVFADLVLISDTGYLVGTKNITNTGYTAVFSDIIEETGLYLQTLATNI